MDDPRFRSQQSPRSNDITPTPMNAFVSPPRNAAANTVSPRQTVPSGSDVRSSLSRRFTMESGRVPTLATMTSPTHSVQVERDYGRMQRLEQKKQEFERIREQRRLFELQMAELDYKQRREAEELAKMEEELRRVGHQSEPSTPPEYRDNSGFPSMFSRPSRYSMSGLSSPMGLFTRSQRSGSQIASPPSGIIGSRYPFDSAPASQLPSRSVPGTRRNSDDEEKESAVRQDPSSHRSGNAFNRYSMPVTRSRNGAQETTIDENGTARFLFGDEEPPYRGGTPDDQFPTLVRRDGQIHSLPIIHTSAIHTQSHQSPPQPADLVGLGSRRSSLRNSADLKYLSETATDMSSVMMSNQASGGKSQNVTTPPKLQSSFSANDVPTIKNPNGISASNMNANNHAQQHFHNHNASMGRIPAGAVASRHSRELSGDAAVTPSREQPQHYPSIQSALQASAAPFGPSSMAPVSVMGNSVSSTGNNNQGNQYNGYFTPNNYGMAPGAAGPNMNNFTGMNGMPTGNGMTGMNHLNQLNGMGGVNGMNNMSSLGMPMLNASMQQMNIGGNGATPGYPSHAYGGYNNAGFSNGITTNNSAPQPPQNQQATSSQPRDSQARVIQNRRQMDNEAMSRYQNMPLESFRGQLHELCKDQHGCRYLQKKLEERNPDQVHTIWLETNQHVIELMTDPFGNYLCQKLLEYCNDDERTVLIQNASQDMVRIALNQHGTRALQKMIEFVNTPQQVQLIIEALRFRVVELIQDLNGNHVIQKCLNKLAPADAQFIFDAVGTHCIEVGTHRHGCCVLQRCIDHASGDQKMWLVQRITEHARVLVQDPFGNYVVQYIIDLNEPAFTEPLVGMFQGCIAQLSRHKFSSNVIEKCLRCAQPQSKDMIVDELLQPQEIERLLRDSFANYVIQTALEYATPPVKLRLVEVIRPFLTQIRHTPYGRRIQAKITAYDNRSNALASGQATPADNTQGQIPLRQAGPGRAMTGNTTMPSGNDMGASNAPAGVLAYPSSNSVTVASAGPGNGSVNGNPAGEMSQPRQSAELSQNAHMYNGSFVGGNPQLANGENVPWV